MAIDHVGVHIIWRDSLHGFVSNLWRNSRAVDGKASLRSVAYSLGIEVKKDSRTYHNKKEKCEKPTHFSTTLHRKQRRRQQKDTPRRTKWCSRRWTATILSNTLRDWSKKSLSNKMIFNDEHAQTCPAWPPCIKLIFSHLFSRSSAILEWQIAETSDYFLGFPKFFSGFDDDSWIFKLFSDLWKNCGYNNLRLQ